MAGAAQPCARPVPSIAAPAVEVAKCRARVVSVWSRAVVSALLVALGRRVQRLLDAHFLPHDLRHRYASMKIDEGVPVTRVAAQLALEEVAYAGYLLARSRRLRGAKAT